MIEVAAIALVFLLFSLFSRKLAATLLSAPLFFLLAGLLLASDVVGLIRFQHLAPILQIVGVTALGLGFFNDAFRINLATRGSDLGLPARLLLLGLPLTFLLGALLARWLFPQLFWVEAALLAIVLTPADTGLISMLASSPRVPLRIRQAINVESSLNDGLTTPIAAIFIALSQTRLGYEGITYRLVAPFEQIAIAGLVGAVVGGLGGWLLKQAETRRWMAPSFHGLVFPSLTALALTAAAALGGNYFIACFLGGSVLGYVMQGVNQRESAFSETLTQLLSLVVFLFLGAKLVELWPAITWQMLLYALLSLTLVRMLPIAAALLGKGLRPESLLFVGWFGPRGLASIVLATIVVGNLPGIPHANTIVAAVTVTVSLSVLLHGISAMPLLIWYGRRMERLGPEAAENQPVQPIPLRLGWWHAATQADERVAGWEARRMGRRAGTAGGQASGLDREGQRTRSDDEDDVVGDGHSPDETVQPVQHAAMPPEEPARLLDSRFALDQGEAQIPYRGEQGNQEADQ